MHRGTVDGEVLTSPKLAADRVARRYPSYDQIPQMFKTAGRAMGGIGANFFSESARIYMQAARNHPYRLALALMMPSIMWELAQASGTTKMSDEEIEELRRDKGMFTVPVPGTDRFVDFTHAVPMQEIFNDFFRMPSTPHRGYGSSGPLESGVEGVRTDGFTQTVLSHLKPWLAPFTEDNVPLMAANIGLRGQDSYGQEIPDDKRIWSKRGLAGLLAPSALNQGLKILDAATEDVDRRGYKQDDLETISGQLGLKISDMSEDDLKKSLEQLRIQMLVTRKNLKKAIIRANRNKQFSQAEKSEEKADARADFNSMRDRIRERMEQVEGALEARR